MARLSAVIGILRSAQNDKSLPSPFQILRQRFPVVSFPPVRQMVRPLVRETSMVEANSGTETFFHQLEPHNGMRPRIPAARAPDLHNTLIRNQLHMPTRKVAAIQREGNEIFRALRFLLCEPLRPLWFKTQAVRRPS